MGEIHVYKTEKYNSLTIKPKSYIWMLVQTIVYPDDRMCRRLYVQKIVCADDRKKTALNLGKKANQSSQDSGRSS